MNAPKVTVHLIGAEREPMVVIENFSSAPDVLREAAAQCTFTAGTNHYPGVRAPVANDYVQQQQPILARVFKDVFSIDQRVAVLDIGYALVTTPPEALALEQRLPHVDALQPGRLALVHYLVPGKSDGTAFYRHRGTGFETLDRQRSTTYFARLNEDLRTIGAPSAYPDQSSELFERIAHFDGLYNRALVYRGRLLHSGAIAQPAALSADPKVGRLTITGFFAAT